MTTTTRRSRFIRASASAMPATVPSSPSRLARSNTSIDRAASCQRPPFLGAGHLVSVTKTDWKQSSQSAGHLLDVFLPLSLYLSVFFFFRKCCNNYVLPTDYPFLAPCGPRTHSVITSLHVKMKIFVNSHTHCPSSLIDLCAFSCPSDLRATKPFASAEEVNWKIFPLNSVVLFVLFINFENH